MLEHTSTETSEVVSEPAQTLVKDELELAEQAKVIELERYKDEFPPPEAQSNVIVSQPPVQQPIYFD